MEQGIDIDKILKQVKELDAKEKIQWEELVNKICKKPRLFDCDEYKLDNHFTQQDEGEQTGKKVEIQIDSTGIANIVEDQEKKETSDEQTSRPNTFYLTLSIFKFRF